MCNCKFSFICNFMHDNVFIHSLFFGSYADHNHNHTVTTKVITIMLCYLFCTLPYQKNCLPMLYTSIVSKYYS